MLNGLRVEGFGGPNCKPQSLDPLASIAFVRIPGVGLRVWGPNPELCTLNPQSPKTIKSLNPVRGLQVWGFGDLPRK